MPNKRHAIIKTNGGLDYRCIYVSLGLDGLTDTYSIEQKKIFN